MEYTDFFIEIGKNVWILLGSCGLLMAVGAVFKKQYLLVIAGIGLGFMGLMNYTHCVRVESYNALIAEAKSNPASIEDHFKLIVDGEIKKDGNIYKVTIYEGQHNYIVHKVLKNKEAANNKESVDVYTLEDVKVANLITRIKANG